MSVPTAFYRRCALFLALAAFAMRVMVPAGFMLDDAPDMPRLVLCSGQGALAPPMMHHAGRTMHHAGSMSHDGKPDAPATADHPCAFSAAAFAADLAAPAAAVVLPPVVAVTVTARPFAAQPGLGLAAPPPPKTGPPLKA